MHIIHNLLHNGAPDSVEDFKKNLNSGSIYIFFFFFLNVNLGRYIFNF